MNNFLRMLSDRVAAQNSRIALLSQKSIRHKIAFYLLELRNGQHPGSTGSVTVELPVSKEVVAKLLAMPRPSFSRELIAMESDGLIEVKGRDVRLLDVATLENDVVEGFQFGR
jgi:CRP-like cAMP-binding protein